MKIGIIIHSKTGNTLHVAQKLAEKLGSNGHEVNIEQIKPVSSEDERDISNIKFEKLPDLNIYDALIIGSPVWGFTATPIIRAFFNKIGSLKQKKVACFATQLFPFRWMGGNSTIAQLIKLCETKEAKVSGTGIVNWMKARRAKTLNETVENLSRLF